MCSTTPTTVAKRLLEPFGWTCSCRPTAFWPGHARAASVSSTMMVCVPRVVVVEEAPGEQARAHRAEERRRDGTAVRRFALPVARGRLVVGIRRERAAAGQRQLRIRPTSVTPGTARRRSSICRSSASRASDVGYFAGRQRDPEGEHARGIEAGMHLLQRREAADRQSRADEQDERQCHLGDHEQAAQPHLRGGRGAGRAQRAIQVDAGGAEGGDETEEDCRQHARGGGKEQRGAVDLDRVEPRQVGGTEMASACVPARATSRLRSRTRRRRARGSRSPVAAAAARARRRARRGPPSRARARWRAPAGDAPRSRRRSAARTDRHEERARSPAARA